MSFTVIMLYFNVLFLSQRGRWVKNKIGGSPIQISHFAFFLLTLMAHDPLLIKTPQWFLFWILRQIYQFFKAIMHVDKFEGRSREFT